MSNHFVQSDAGLRLEASQWTIASDASINDDQDRAVIVIHSLATAVTPISFKDSLLADLAQFGALDSPVYSGFAAIIEERLGIQLDIKYLVQSEFGAPRHERVSTQLLEAWLRHMGLPPDLDLAAVLLQIPVPVLGSPPEEWKKIADLVSGAAPSPYLFAAGYAAWGDRPALAIIAGGTGLVVWFAKPFGTTVRDHYVKTLKAHLEWGASAPGPDE